MIVYSSQIIFKKKQIGLPKMHAFCKFLSLNSFFLYLPIYQSIYLSVCLSVCLSLSVYLSETREGCKVKTLIENSPLGIPSNIQIGCTFSIKNHFGKIDKNHEVFRTLTCTCMLFSNFNSLMNYFNYYNI